MRQLQALQVMMSGSSVFLTGAPGAGKTYVLNKFIQQSQKNGKQLAVTASTGIAASHIGGTTIHSWSGLGILDVLSESDLVRLSEADRLIKRYNATDILIIDEVSMLHGKRLNMINRLAKRLRGNDKPFGGLQIILVGDLFQLPPISRGGESLDFIHNSEAWEELNPEICYISEQHRQQEHDYLLELLEAMRDGEVSEDQSYLLNERLNQKPGDDTVVTRLYSHNIDVDSINRRYLGELDGDAVGYKMYTKGKGPKLDQLMKSLLTPEVLELKIGAEVMFVANNFAEGFVNGSRGQVIDFDGDAPMVQLAKGKTIKVQPHTWSLNEDGRVLAEATQLPLRLAWAITIHKSQGMSIEAAEIDLTRAFTPGMGYVALSRVTSFSGLYLVGMNHMALAMHPEIYALDRELREASEELSLDTSDYEPPAKKSQDVSGIVDEALFNKLKQWRQKRAEQDHVPPYVIAHNTSLSAISIRKPQSLEQLRAIPGFGVKKVDSYGEAILQLIGRPQTDSTLK
jgi:ATP-dependent DNA helicase PIF1